MIKAGNLKPHDRVRHGFFTRRGGVSHGLYESLNCGLKSGDSPDSVRVNRARAMDMLGLKGDALATVSQIHSAEVAVIDAPLPPNRPVEADAMVTRTPGVALGIVTADCAPVLMADVEAGVIGAAHAGWRGARGGVLENAIDAMCNHGARREAVIAAVGPCIRQPSYEVGPEFQAEFMSESPENEKFFVSAEREGHFRFDLPGYVRARLANAGLGSVDVIAADTCADAERFFSYRRATLKGEKSYGRGLSAIALAG